MEAEIKPRRLRIVCGPVPVVEEQLEQLLEDYTAIVWSFFDCAGVPTASVVMVSNAEMRKAAFMQAGAARRN